MKGDIIAVIAAIAAIFGLIAAILGFMNAREARKATKLAADAAQVARDSAAVVQTISVNVDGRLDGLFMRVGQLTDTLKSEGIKVPAALPKPKSQENVS
jgi:hypothetical protein